MPRTVLRVSLGSALAPCVASNSSGRVVGEIHRNTLPNQAPTLIYEGHPYRIQYRPSSDRYLVNDAHFDLVSERGTIASADRRVGDPHFDIRIGNDAYRLVKRTRWLSLHYTLESVDGGSLGSIVETTGFSLWRRRFRIEISLSIEGAAALFLFFLAANATYR